MDACPRPKNLFLYEINQANCDSMMKEMLGFADSNRDKALKPEIVLHISSGGGTVTSGLALYSMIMKVRMELDFIVETRVLSHAMSMAAIILQAGTRRYMSPVAQIMLHDINATLAGGSELRVASERSIEMMRHAGAGILARHNTAGKTDPKYWLDNFYTAAGQYMDAPAAVSLGLADSVLPWWQSKEGSHEPSSRRTKEKTDGAALPPTAH